MNWNKAAVAAAVPGLIGTLSVFFNWPPEMQAALATVITPIVTYVVPNQPKP